MAVSHPSSLSESDSKTVWQPGDRAHPKFRAIQDLPLTDTELDLPVTEADFGRNAEWPPSRMAARNNRLDLYSAIYRGDLTNFVQDGSAVCVVVNYPGRFSNLMAALMVSTKPPPEVQDAIANAVVHMTEYGRAYLVNLSGRLSAMTPANCYRHMDNDTLYVLAPYYTDKSNGAKPDRAIIYAVPSQGTAVGWTVDISNNSIGEAGPSQQYPNSGWAMANRHPHFGGWGTSSFDNLIAPTLMISKRLSSNDYVIDRNSYPLLLLPMPRAGAIHAVLKDADQADAFSHRQLQQAVSDALSTNDKLWVPDGVNTANAKYLEWDGALQSSFAQLDEAKEAIRSMSGMLNILEMEGGALSGVALKELDLPLYWEGQLLWNELNEAVEEATGRPSGWADPFEADMPPMAGEDRSTDEQQGQPV